MKTVAEIREILIEALQGPISRDLFEDPVITPCGHTFENEQISTHLTGQGEYPGKQDCPECRNSLQSDQLVSNDLVKQLVALLSKPSEDANKNLTEFLATRFLAEDSSIWSVPKTLGCGHSFDANEFAAMGNKINDKLHYQCRCCNKLTKATDVRENHALKSIINHSSVYEFVVTMSPFLTDEQRQQLLLPYEIISIKDEEVDEFLQLHNLNLLVQTDIEGRQLLVLVLDNKKSFLLKKYMQKFGSDWLVSRFVSDEYTTRTIALLYEYFNSDFVELLRFLRENLNIKTHNYQLEAQVIAVPFRMLGDQSEDAVPRFFEIIESTGCQPFKAMMLDSMPAFQWVVQRISESRAVTNWVAVLHKLMELPDFNSSHCCSSNVTPLSLFFTHTGEAAPAWNVLVRYQQSALIHAVLDKLALITAAERELHGPSLMNFFITVFRAINYDVDLIRRYSSLLARPKDSATVMRGLLLSCYKELILKVPQGLSITLELIDSLEDGVNRRSADLPSIFSLAVEQYVATKAEVDKSKWYLLICRLLPRANLINLNQAYDKLVATCMSDELVYFIRLQFLITGCHEGKIDVALQKKGLIVNSDCYTKHSHAYAAAVIKSESDNKDSVIFIYRLFHALFKVSVADLNTQYVNIPASVASAQRLLDAAETLFRALEASDCKDRELLLSKLQKFLVVIVESWCCSDTPLSAQDCCQLIAAFRQMRLATWHPGWFRIFNPDWVTPRLNQLFQANIDQTCSQPVSCSA